MSQAHSTPIPKTGARRSCEIPARDSCQSVLGRVGARGLGRTDKDKGRVEGVRARAHDAVYDGGDAREQELAAGEQEGVPLWKRRRELSNWVEREISGERVSKRKRRVDFAGRRGEWDVQSMKSLWSAVFRTMAVCCEPMEGAMRGAWRCYKCACSQDRSRGVWSVQAEAFGRQDTSVPDRAG